MWDVEGLIKSGCKWAQTWEMCFHDSWLYDSVTVGKRSFGGLGAAVRLVRSTLSWRFRSWIFLRAVSSSLYSGVGGGQLSGGGTGVGCLTLRLIGYKVGSVWLRSRSYSTFGSWMVVVVVGVLTFLGRPRPLLAGAGSGGTTEGTVVGLFLAITASGSLNTLALWAGLLVSVLVT